MSRIQLISAVLSSEKAVKKILQTSPVVGMSCKGANLGQKGGSIYLIVVSTPDDGVYVFDVRRDRNIVLDGGLVRLLQSTDVLKVIHNCGPDSATLHFEFGVKLRNCFDTQVAYRVILEQQGLPPRVTSFPNLCAVYHIQLYQPTAQLQQLLKDDQNVWARRPITKDMLNTAAADVIPLTSCLHRQLSSELLEESMEWFDVLCEENRQSYIFYNSVAKRRKQRKDLTFTKELQDSPVMKLTDTQRHFVRGSVTEGRN
ncbi:egalitarian protein homolog isoform X2 [Gigantopelta aegis]|nr:egalitarian protein homolog isoform X2 [Gigantopelta aegis]XP_041360824.1 egalitarian protein homolog isoform X2 [Gigantopelta aegis]